GGGGPGPGRAGPDAWAGRSRSPGSGGNLPAVVGGRAPKEREARPRGPKPPRWSAERRASRVISAFTRVLTRYGTQGASLGAWPAASCAGLTGVPLSTRTFLGAPPTPRFGVGEAKMQSPGAENAPRERGGVRVLEIARPGMEDSGSAKKQENTGNGPAVRAARLILRSADAEDVPQTCRRVRASRRMRTDTAWPSCFETHRSAFGLWRRLRSRRAAMLLSMRAGEAPTCGCTKSRLGQFPLFRIDINNGNCNSNVFGHRGPYHPHMSATMWHHPSSSRVSPSVVIMCFAFEPAMPTLRIHITTSNPPPGPRPR